MSSFYDKITTNLRFAFQFDKIYPTYSAMIDGKDTDDVYVGRYVLIKKQPNQNAQETLSANQMPDGRMDWQGTVWQKSRLSTGNIDYVFVADLDVQKPNLSVTVDMPIKQEKLNDLSYANAAYFAEDSTENEWKLHIPALWNLRLGDELDFNKEGFNKNKGNFINSPIDSISHSYHSSGLKYWNRNPGQNEKSLDNYEDIYQIDIKLQSIGNTISKVWDTLYGSNVKTIQRGRYFFYDSDKEQSDTYLFTNANEAARNQDIRWDSYDGIRSIPKNRVGATNKYFYSDYKTNLESVAGAINSTHDLMGMIIRDYEKSLSNAKNWDPSKIYYIDHKFYRKAEQRTIVKNSDNNKYEEVALLNLNANNLYREDWGEYSKFLPVGTTSSDSSYPAGKKYINYRKPSMSEHLPGSMYRTVTFTEKTLDSNWTDIRPAWAMIEKDNYYVYDSSADAPARKTAPYFKITSGPAIGSHSEVYIPGLYWAIKWKKNSNDAWVKERTMQCITPYESLYNDVKNAPGWGDAIDNEKEEGEQVRFYNIDFARIETVTEGNQSITGPAVSAAEREKGKFFSGLRNLKDNYYVKENNNYTRINRNYINESWNYRDPSGKDLPWWIANKNGTLVTATIKSAGVVYGLDDTLDKWFYKSANDYVKETMWRMPIINNAVIYEADPSNSISYTGVLGDGKKYYTNISLTTEVNLGNFGSNATRTAYRPKEYYIYSSTNSDYKEGNKYYGDPDNIPAGVELGVAKIDYVAEEIPNYSYDLSTMNGLILGSSRVLKRLELLESDLNNAVPQIRDEVDNINNFSSINVTVNNETTPINPNGKTNTLTLKAGNNITLTANNSNKEITIGHAATYSTVDAGAYKVGRDATGHVVLGGGLTASDVGLGNVTNYEQIPKSIGTAKGDLIYWTGKSTPSKLAIGTAGQVLKVGSDGVPVWGNDIDTDYDTKNTAGATKTNSDIYLIGATSQDSNPQTYSSNTLIYSPSEKRLKIGENTYLKSYAPGEYNPLGEIEKGPFDNNPVLNIEKYQENAEDKYIPAAINAAGLFWNGHRAVFAADSHGQPHSFQIDFNNDTRAVEIWVDGGNASGGRPFVIFTQGS